MPVDNVKASDVWLRYQWLRDNGHHKYVEKAARCEDFFEGLQWTKEDIALLKAYRRPALTINKIISTISNVMGEQIFNRTDISFKPRNKGASAEIADALTKVFMQISDNNHLPWVRSDVFADGVITSRGFYDVRLNFDDSMRGEVQVEQLNPKNVLIDADASEYDPDQWYDVIITKWMSVDQIEMMYSKKDADMLRGRTDSYFPYGYDAYDSMRDRFGDPIAFNYNAESDESRNGARNIRVLERQWKKLDFVRHFVNLSTGDMRPIPSDWDENRVMEYLSQNPDIFINKKLVHRIRWTVVADNLVLHDDWSPFKHFTVVPYFPYFRRGRTVGLVENLLGPQELLNKVSSQELHVVNTTANSGWKVRRNALQNMSIAELENRGAQTGLVLELDELTNAEKIQPNQTPSGLDRISYKAEEHIKSISGVSDYMQGFAREDVAAKSVRENKVSGQANLAKIMDNLIRTDHILARNILDIIQEYYTEERLIFITTDRLTNKVEEMAVNQPTPEGTIANDLTIGEYMVVVTTQPERDNFEETNFDQAVALRTEVGVNIPDRFIIEASKLRNKADIIAAIGEDNESPEAQQRAQMQQRVQEAEVQKLESEVMNQQADAQLKMARAQKEQQGDTAEASIEMRKLDMEMALERERMEREFALKREEMLMNMQLKREEMRQKAAMDRVSQIRKAQGAE
jgi:hypothetical protein